MALTRRHALALAALPLRGGADTGTRLIYARLSQDPNPETRYALELLSAALAAAGHPMSLEPSAMALPQTRALHQLASGAGVDITWSMTNAQREAQALPIRVPIFRGLFGWRLLVARRERVAALSAVRDVEGLRRFQFVQGLGWPDVDVLRHAGLPVIVSSSFEAMYNQLRLGHADAFPRSVEEVGWELEKWGEGLAIVPDLVLHYPAAVYFFVRQGQEALAQAIESGLTRLQASGAFERLFQRYQAANLARAQLGRRRVIELVNPQLPPQTPLAHADWWYRP